MDAAFHLEINEFRGRRSVQLTICDVQLSDCEHLADQKILNLYNTLMQDGPLTAREARLLLPDRKDLVAVWRHVTCRAEDGRFPYRTGHFPAGLHGKADATLTSASCLSVWTFFRVRTH